MINGRESLSSRVDSWLGGDKMEIVMGFIIGVVLVLGFLNLEDRKDRDE